MKNYSVFFSVFVITSGIFISCNNDNMNPSAVDSEAPILSAKERVCLDVTLSEELPDGSTPSSITRGAILVNKKWPQRHTIRIKFLNGNSFLQQKVYQYADVWLRHANLRFQYVGRNDNADIKINFDASGKSWSKIGIDARGVGQYTPSMNFGWFNNSTPDMEFSRTIIHEFGHALGLVHEHQSPSANIQWNKPVVYNMYAGSPNYWNKNQVDHDIFNKYSSTTTNYSSFDSQSIMLYSFPRSFTLNGWSAPNNTTLSQMDKNFISYHYQ